MEALGDFLRDFLAGVNHGHELSTGKLTQYASVILAEVTNANNGDLHGWVRWHKYDGTGTSGRFLV
ncbi:MAG: hypothetical protein BroJett014_18940 [Planctomycetota bacterium]|nr:MAG: hypothetical protein BroJett014_18940 [Planctomycetota bacterium]